MRVGHGERGRILHAAPETDLHASGIPDDGSRLPVAHHAPRRVAAQETAIHAAQQHGPRVHVVRSTEQAFPGSSPQGVGDVLAQVVGHRFGRCSTAGRLDDCHAQRPGERVGQRRRVLRHVAQVEAALNLFVAQGCAHLREALSVHPAEPLEGPRQPRQQAPPFGDLRRPAVRGALQAPDGREHAQQHRHEVGLSAWIVGRGHHVRRDPLEHHRFHEGGGLRRLVVDRGSLRRVHLGEDLPPRLRVVGDPVADGLGRDGSRELEAAQGERRLDPQRAADVDGLFQVRKAGRGRALARSGKGDGLLDGRAVLASQHPHGEEPLVPVQFVQLRGHVPAGSDGGKVLFPRLRFRLERENRGHGAAVPGHHEKGLGTLPRAPPHHRRRIRGRRAGEHEPASIETGGQLLDLRPTRHGFPVSALELGQVEPQRAARLRIVARDDPGQRNQSPAEGIEPALRILEHSRRPPGEHPAGVVALLGLDDGPPATLANGCGAGSGRILADLARDGTRGPLRSSSSLGDHPHGFADDQGIRRHEGEGDVVGVDPLAHLHGHPLAGVVHVAPTLGKGGGDLLAAHLRDVHGETSRDPPFLAACSRAACTASGVRSFQ